MSEVKTGTDRKAYKREWARKWRRANPEKERANQERYWARRLQRQQLALQGPAGT